ncbi:lycopene cyclase family protein [Rhodoflexus sp.]
MQKRYDYIFAGGGMSALLLASELLQKEELQQATFLIIDPRLYEYPTRNICFWAKEPPDLPISYKNIWNKAFFAGLSGETCEDVSPYQYYCFDLSAFMNSLLQHFAAHSNVVLMKTNVLQITGNHVITDAGNLEANCFVFDSIPRRQLPQPIIWQHFLGWEIVCDEEVFDTESFRLMDFRVDQSHGPAFMYLLPFDEKSALIEFTLMSTEILPDQVYEQHMAAYMQRFFKGAHYYITGAERGQIPMSMHIRGVSKERYLTIGTSGGFTKPTTGYTFMNVWRYSRQLAADIVAGRAVSLPKYSGRFRFYDSLLLNIMLRSPQEVRPIMEKLFLSNPTSRILTFLSEESSIGQESRIFSSLPWAPFFKAIYHEYLVKPS